MATFSDGGIISANRFGNVALRDNVMCDMRNNRERYVSYFGNNTCEIITDKCIFVPAKYGVSR